jgi:hypothetical protein
MSFGDIQLDLDASVWNNDHPPSSLTLAIEFGFSHANSPASMMRTTSHDPIRLLSGEDARRLN